MSRNSPRRITTSDASRSEAKTCRHDHVREFRELCFIKKASRIGLNRAGRGNWPEAVTRKMRGRKRKRSLELGGPMGEAKQCASVDMLTRI